MNLLRENTIKSLKNNKIENHLGIKIQEICFINKINLRINPENLEYMKACSKILNTILPTKPNTFVKNGNLKIIWLSPDEWLITNDIDNDNLFAKLRNEVGDLEASVTDISENRTIVRISGEKIYKLLSKFLVLDLEKNLPTKSTCAQTLFVKVPILLLRNHSDNQLPEVDLFLIKSHANYVYNLIVDGTENLDF
ncbi:MAG: hypothetical protein CFH15_00237 [Alphaproteobacteria bacterium MarineAlpha5_Bin5]|nr:MAG: hypothetical protein CFH14_01197 [Alphaproteobacteria bacterium MarineAlpha5_Bin4]PPR50703.1 MAG: hypothetical protein CFH15_00237 [Alphaproteobacteria bacterium MarineAlpha5_Bin5]|tara:strand:+ start:2255 stop:2839 length:585 start_codon:yes stop_codon:yes gene_type:complete